MSRYNKVWFEVHTVVTMSSFIFWDITPMKLCCVLRKCPMTFTGLQELYPRRQNTSGKRNLIWTHTCQIYISTSSSWIVSWGYLHNNASLFHSCICGDNVAELRALWNIIHWTTLEPRFSSKMLIQWRSVTAKRQNKKIQVIYLILSVNF